MSGRSKSEKIIRDIKRKYKKILLLGYGDIIELYNEMATRLAV